MKEVVLSLDRRVENLGKTLVGKIIMNKKLNILAVIAMIKKGWQMDDDGVEVHELERSQLVFLFRFHDVQGYARILRGRPWSIQGFLLNLQPNNLEDGLESALSDSFSAQVNSSGPLPLVYDSPPAHEVGPGYQVDFPCEIEPNNVKSVEVARLSPISSMALSLQSINLKRPFLDELDSTIIKRQRRLLFDEFDKCPVMSPAVLNTNVPLPSSGHNKRGRYRSYKNLKAIIRNKEVRKVVDSQSDSLTPGEIDFLRSWLSGCETFDEDSPLSVPHTVGGWTEPATGSP
ncbi:hypothetical protein K1719_000338 [Acacia pycnantha]|nr:hypothetical protein K1719_000338 [Acacia pycnantha]